MNLNLFVDDVLDDMVRRWMRERDAQPARQRDECADLSRLQACARLRRAPPVDPLRLNALRGRCAEERIVLRMCRRGQRVRNQFRVQPGLGRHSPVLDVSPFPGAPRRIDYGVESKHVHAPAYAGPGGLARLQAEVAGHVSQVREQMRRSALSSALPGLPRIVQLWYQVGGTTTMAQFQSVARAIQSAVRRANAGPAPGPRVIVQVRRVNF